MGRPAPLLVAAGAGAAAAAAAPLLTTRTYRPTPGAASLDASSVTAERNVCRSVGSPHEMIRLPLDGDVCRRRLLSSRDGVDHLNERLCVALFLLAAPLLVAAVRLLVVLPREKRRRGGQRGRGNGQYENPTNMHHASPEQITYLGETPDHRHTKQGQVKP